MPRQRPSYWWARHIAADDPRLSWEGREGLQLAREIAEDDLERSRDAITQGVGADRPMTLKEAAEYCLSRHGRPYSATTVRRRIEQARFELFGRITDRAIYYRLRRARQLEWRPPRTCEAPGCSNQLPREARSVKAG